MTNIFNKKQESKKESKNWFEDQYDSLKTQRNWLFILTILLVALTIISIIGIIYILNVKKFDPFVVQINDNTGVTQVIKPGSINNIQGTDALAKYFIKKYIRARESYNPVDFYTEARKTVRLFSNNNVYRPYRNLINDEDKSPANIYADNNTTFINFKSWSKLEDKKYLVRFSVNESSGQKNTYNKIAVVQYDYFDIELTEQEEDINPVGFIVTGYRIDDDKS